jgi:hypothetical protein
MPTTTVVAEAQDPLQAEIWLDALRSQGIEAASFERGVGGALGGALTAGFAVYPIIVAQADLAAARGVIAQVAGASAIAPVRDSAETRAAQHRALIAVGVIAVAILVAGVLGRLVAY